MSKILLKFICFLKQELMKEAYNRSLDREGMNGLIILNAIYGNLPSNVQQQYDKLNVDDNDLIINVVIPLQVLIKDHSLQILTDTTKVYYY